MSIINDNIEKDQVAEVKQVQQELKKEYVRSITPKRGHTLFEINLKDRTIVPAEFEEQDVEFNEVVKTSKGLAVQTYKDGRKKIILDKPTTHSKKLIRKENCIYISALNRKNVLKKLEQRGVIKIHRK